MGHLHVAVQRRVGDAVHDGQRAGEATAAQAFRVVAAHDLVAVDDPDAAGVLLAVAQEDVPLDQVAVAVAHRVPLGDCHPSAPGATYAFTVVSTSLSGHIVMRSAAGHDFVPGWITHRWSSRRSWMATCMERVVRGASAYLNSNP